MTITGASRKQAGLYYDKGGAVLNVMHPDFGAKGDGTTDDGPACQSAINAAYALASALGIMIWVYLPLGTYKLATYQGDSFTLLKSKSYVGVFGPGTLKAANGLRTTSTGIAILYNNTEALTNVFYRDFTVDFNGQNNLFITGYGITGAINRMGGGAGCSNILCDNLTLKNSAGAHFLFFDGIGGTNVKGRNLTFLECGQSIVGNQATDHSSIYCTSDHSEFYSSKFANANPCNISTAMETHGSDIILHDNEGINYSTAWNCCAQVQSVADLKWHDNTFRQVRNGVVFWSSAANAMSRFTSHHNTLGLREATGGYAAGAAFSCSGIGGTFLSSVNMSHFTSDADEIFGETTAQLTTLTQGYHLTRCDDIRILHPKIRNLVAEAIYIESESTPRSIDRVTIADPDIRDVGLTSTAANKRAIVLNSFTVAGQKISTVNISNPRILLSAPAGTVANYGIQFNNGSFPDTRITNPTIIGAAISPITKGATISADLFFIDGEGPGTPFNLIRASLGSRWVDSSSSPRRTYNATKSASDGASDVWQSVEYGTVAPASGSHQVGDLCYNTAPTTTSNIGWECVTLGTPGTWKPFGIPEAISGTKGDADATIVTLVDPTIIWYGTALTVNRTVTLSATNAYNGARFRVLRTGLGAFTLDVGGLKTIPNSTAAFVDVAHNGSTWQLAGYGTL